MTRLARQTIASIHNRKRPEGRRSEGAVMSACMPHARLAGDGMPEGSSQKSSTGVPFAVVSRKNCSSRFSHLMRQAGNQHGHQAQSSAIKPNQSQSMVIKRARFGYKGEQR